MGRSINARLKRTYWQLTALALTAYLAGWATGLAVAVAVTGWQTVHFAAVRRSPVSFEVQVRAAYLGLLLIGLVPSLGLMHVALCIGLNAMLVTDYCPMARTLALAPWNRTVPLTGALLRWLIFSPPAPGSILERMAAAGPVSGPRGVRRDRSFR